MVDIESPMLSDVHHLGKQIAGGARRGHAMMATGDLEKGQILALFGMQNWFFRPNSAVTSDGRPSIAHLNTTH